MNVFANAKTPRTSSFVLRSVSGDCMACQALCTIAWPSMSMSRGFSGKRGIGSVLALVIIDTSGFAVIIPQAIFPQKAMGMPSHANALNATTPPSTTPIPTICDRVSRSPSSTHAIDRVTAG